MKPVIFHHEALAELDEAAAWYERRQEGLAARFVAAVFKCAEHIPRRAWLPPLQHKKLRGFSFAELPRNWPYRLIVRVEPEHFVVLAVAHERRRPGYWRRRAER